MRVLLVVSSPNSSLDVIAQAVVSAVEPRGIEVVLLYAPMFQELMQTCPAMLEEIDLIHFIAGVESFPFDIVKKAAACCSIASTYHHRQFSELPSQFQLVNHCFYVSDSSGVDLQKSLTLSCPATLLSNGVNTRFFTLGSKRRDGFVIGFFGTQPPEYGDRKGTDLLLGAVRRIVESGFKPSFLVVGYGWKQLVSSLVEIGVRVQYEVNVEDKRMPDYYHQLDLYLITSRLEGGPLTLLEAGSCGVPIISTPVGLAPEVLTEDGCGKLLNGFTSDEISLAIIEDIQNPSAAKRRAESVRAEIHRRWDWSHTYQDLPVLYANIGKRVKTRSRKEIPANDISQQYLDLSQPQSVQRKISMKYAQLSFAWRLYDRGEKRAAWQLALKLVHTISFSYWVHNFLKNVIAVFPPVSQARAWLTKSNRPAAHVGENA